MRLRFPWRRIEPQERYGLVILLICLSYCLAAAFDNARWANITLFVQLLTVWLAFGISSSHRAQRLTALALFVGGVAWLVALVVGSGHDRAVDSLLFALNALLYMIAPLLIVRAIFRRPAVDLQTLLGAVAAYLLFGMMFAFVFRALGEIFTSPPFFGDQGPGTMSQTLFFSFVTLSTTGYGNLVPAANPGQTLSVLEAIMGQLFLVTAVAKIVADWQSPPRASSTAAGPAPNAPEAPALDAADAADA